jgi:hypothetical protein
MPAAKKCPRCRLVNPPEGLRCDCGYDFDAGEMRKTYLTNKDLIRADDDAKANRDQYRVLGFFRWFRWFG